MRDAAVAPGLDASIDDVWSRTASKYRLRAVILLLANMVMFGGLCCFMFWLRTGWAFPPTYEHYADEFLNSVRIVGEGQVTPYDLLTDPINLRLVPMHGVVVGLLIASLTAIPILVSMLYRLPAALPFCAMVGLLAVMPWLSANLVLGSIIAQAARKRLKFRFAAALLAMVPIGIYLMAATRQYAAPLDLLKTNFEKGLVVVPLLLAVVGACALMAAVLAIAHLVNYRPGAITPLIAVMFLAPWFLFVSKVGRDELYYRFLEQRYGPQSTEYFVATDANRYIRQVAQRMWFEASEPRPTIEELETRVLQFWDAQFDSLDDVVPVDQAVNRELLKQVKEFAKEQHTAVVACDSFMKTFPESVYIPSVLYIKGRVLSLRINRHLFRDKGLVRYYGDYPSERARETWLTLVNSYGDSPLADIARYQLAQLDARRALVDQALVWLDQVGHGAASAQVAPQPAHLLTKKPPAQSLEGEYAGLSHDVAALRGLLLNNRDPLTGDAPLVDYLRCDSRHEAYLQNLGEILERYDHHAHLRIRDNIELELALQCMPAERIARLERTRQRFPDGDAIPRVLYELGLAYEAVGQATEARACYETVIERFAGSRYAAESRRRRGKR